MEAVNKIDLERILLSVLLKSRKLPQVRESFFSGVIQKIIYDVSVKNTAPIPRELAQAVLLKKAGSKASADDCISELEKIYKIDIKKLNDKSISEMIDFLEEYADIDDAHALLDSAQATLEKGDIEKAKIEVRKMLLLGSNKSSGRDLVASHDLRMEELKQQMKEQRRGVPIGIDKFDAGTNGILAGELCYVIGEPSVGKSMQLEFAGISAWLPELNCFGIGHNVAYISLEMPVRELEQRALSMLSRVKHSKFRHSALSKDDFTKFDKTFKRLRDMHDNYFWFEQMPAHTSCEDIFSKAEQIQDINGKPLHLLIVDYANLVGKDRQWESQSETSRMMKALTGQWDNGKGIVTLSALQQDAKADGKKERGVFDAKYCKAYIEDCHIAMALVTSKELKLCGNLEMQFVKFRNGQKLAPLTLKPNYDFMLMTDRAVTKRAKNLESL